MKLSRDQKRAKLEEAAAEMIEALLDWEDWNATPDLTEIEEEVLTLRERIGQELAETVMEGQEARQPVAPPICAGCGEEMRYKGRKRKGIESRVGELEVERGYYYCSRCERGFFPPG